VRRVLGAMKKEELELLARRQRAATASGRKAVLVVVAAYAALLLALAYAEWALRRSAQRRLLAEQEAARLEATLELAQARRERDDFRERFLAQAVAERVRDSVECCVCKARHGGCRQACWR
jgi:hypothetical protein